MINMSYAADAQPNGDAGILRPRALRAQHPQVLRTLTDEGIISTPNGVSEAPMISGISRSES